MPISGIDNPIARSNCRYMGKELPTMDQWQKAFRGGVGEINGKPNPYPGRATPWGERDGPTTPEHPLAPVGAHPRDVSPYGVFDLAGNVSEWSLIPAYNKKGLRYIHGGSWDPLQQAGHERIFFRNTRPEEARDYAVGARCVSSSSSSSSSSS